jgi:hypothetical protein
MVAYYRDLAELESRDWFGPSCPILQLPSVFGFDPINFSIFDIICFVD